MADLANEFGSDLRLSASGDLALSTGSAEARERVVRRLLTNQNDYLWDLRFGAGLPAQVGENTSAAAIEAVVRRQLLYEEGVQQFPPPTVSVTPIFGGAVVNVAYRDRQTGQQVSQGFSVER